MCTLRCSVVNKTLRNIEEECSEVKFFTRILPLLLLSQIFPNSPNQPFLVQEVLFVVSPTEAKTPPLRSKGDGEDTQASEYSLTAGEYHPLICFKTLQKMHLTTNYNLTIKSAGYQAVFFSS